MDAFVYAAALWCDACAGAVFRDLARNGKIPADAAAFCPDDCRKQVHPGYVWADETQTDRSQKLQCPDCLFEQDADDWEWDETTYDSDHMPKGPYPDGGGEADSPQHCDGCGVHLENLLTAEGSSYVKDAFRRYYCGKGGSSREVVAGWAEAYPEEVSEVHAEFYEER